MPRARLEEIIGLAVEHNSVLGCSCSVLHLSHSLQSRYHISILLNLRQKITPLSAICLVRICVPYRLSIRFSVIFLNQIATSSANKHGGQSLSFLFLFDLVFGSLLLIRLLTGKTVHNLGKHKLHGEETSENDQHAEEEYRNYRRI